jgi:hypothetical protein
MDSSGFPLDGNKVFRMVILIEAEEHGGCQELAGRRNRRGPWQSFCYSDK